MLVGLALRGSGRDKVEAMTIHDWRSHVMVQRNHEVVHTRARQAGWLPGLRSFLAWYWCSRTPAIVLHHELRVLFLLTRGLPNSFHFLTCVTRPQVAKSSGCVQGGRRARGGPLCRPHV